MVESPKFIPERDARGDVFSVVGNCDQGDWKYTLKSTSADLVTDLADMNLLAKDHARVTGHGVSVTHHKFFAANIT